MKKVIGIIQEHTDVPLKIEPFRSPEMFGSQPAWGSGGGVLHTKGENAGKAFVDPFSHPTVAAHEAAHQGFMTDLATSEVGIKKRKELINNPDNFTDAMVDKGALK